MDSGVLFLCAVSENGIADLLLHKCYELLSDLANSSSGKCLKSGVKWCKVFEKGCKVVDLRKEGRRAWLRWLFLALLIILWMARAA